jgi:RNA polymerase sigma factor (sigma-70 family)
MTTTTMGRQGIWQAAVTRVMPTDFAPATFYRTWFARIHAYFARRTPDAATAEDLTADTFERIVSALPGFRPNDNPAAERVWVYRIAANVYKNHLREAGRRQARDATWAADWEPVAGGDREQSIALGQAVATLDAGDQDMLGLRYWEGLTAGEIGDVLGLSQREVYTGLERCLRALRRQLTEGAPGVGGLIRETGNE